MSLPYMNRRRFKDCSKAQRDQFDFAARMHIAVAAMVFLFEIAKQSLRKGKIEFVSLAPVTNINTAVGGQVALPAFGGEICLRRLFKPREFLIQLWIWDFLLRTPQNCARIIFHDVASEDA